MRKIAFVRALTLIRVCAVITSAPALFICLTIAICQRSAGQTVAPTASPDTSNWKTYRSDLHGFELKYPPTWSVHEGSGTMEGVLFCKTPYADASTGVQFAVQRKANPNGLSIEKWVADELQKTGTNSVPQISIRIGGDPAVRLQVRTTYEIVARWNTQGILNISYHSSQPDLEETYATILSTFRFL